MKIDVHTHIIPEKLPKWTDKFGYGKFIYLDHYRQNYARMMQGNTFFREIYINCWDPQVRIKEYNEYNTQYQVVCTIPVMFSYWASAKDGLEVSEFLNDHIADLVHTHPKNYIGLGTIPLQDIDRSLKELERIKEIGLKGIQIGSNINDKNLSEPEFDPIWQKCEELSLAILIHPWNMMGKKDMERYWLPWLVGMPAETSRAACSMIFSGVFDRYPKLRVLFSHAGGSLLATIGRIEHGFNCRPDLVAIDNPVNPREYIGKFWIDSITHDPKYLNYVMDLQGSDKICLGTDYPFPLGDLQIGAFIEEMNMPQTDLDNIMYKSALNWLGIKESEL